MSRRPVRALLQDIIEYGEEAVATVGELDGDAILAERFREHAVLRTVQIVGEASAQILQVRPQGIEGLALRDATGLRNILVHGYAKARMDRVVIIVRRDVVALVNAAKAALATGEDYE